MINSLCYERQVHYSQLQPLNHTIWLNNPDYNPRLFLPNRALLNLLRLFDWAFYGSRGRYEHIPFFTLSKNVPAIS